MKLNFATLTLLALSIAFTGCRREAHPTDPAFGRTTFIDEQSRPPDRDEGDADRDDTEVGDTPAENPDQPVAPPTNPVPPPVVSAPAFAKKVEGKPGFVESPYAQGKLIDVRGLPPGTEIECPYTKRPIAIP